MIDWLLWNPPVLFVGFWALCIFTYAVGSTAWVFWRDRPHSGESQEEYEHRLRGEYWANGQRETWIRRV